ncbi:MAG: hypothetical protein H7308_03960 [Chthonomonadaceae bacterium]|nr:hypothetical protein [Chthonomonadaceae bacterium]
MIKIFVHSLLCVFVLLFCAATTTFPLPTKPPVQIEMRQDKPRPTNPPQLKTVFYTEYKTKLSKEGFMLPYRAFMRLDIQTRKDFSQKIFSTKRLFQVDENVGGFSFVMAPSWSQAIVLSLQSDYIPGFTQLNNLEWVSTTGTRRKPLTDDHYGYTQVVWSPDEKKIAYSSPEGRDYISGSPFTLRYAVYSHNLKTGKRRRLFKEQTPDQDDLSFVPQILLWISPTQLLYWSSRPRGLFLLDTQGKPPVRLTMDAPDVISLKDRIALFYNGNHTIKVIELPPALSELALRKTWKHLETACLLTLPQLPSEVCFSPEGHTAIILFRLKTGEDTLQSLFLLDFATRRTRFIGSTEKRISHLQWSKDAHWLLMSVSSPFPYSGLQQSIVAVPKGTPPDVPFTKTDWNQTTPLQWTEILALPENSDQFEWRE